MTLGRDDTNGKSLITAPKLVIDRRTIKIGTQTKEPRKARPTFVAVVLAVFVVMGLAMVIAPGGTGQTNTWTFMVYLDADNDLEYWGIEDFLEMASVGSTADLNIVVQFDRNPLFGFSGYDDRYDDWSDTRRYYITQGMTPTVANATWSGGEINMGDPLELIDFVSWSVDNYPANHYVLVLWDHGANWDGICWDFTDSNDYLDMYDLDYALDIIGYDYSILLDVIAFDACIMSSIEVAYQVEPYAQYMVGSEIGVPEAGFEYGGPLAALADNPDMTALSFSNEILNSTSEYYLSLLGTPQEYLLNESFEYSVIDLGLLSNVVAAIDDLSVALMGNITSWVNHVNLAWTEAEKYEGVYSEDIVDLYHISEKLREIIPNGTLDDLALNVMNSVQQAVLAEVHGTNPANPGTPVNHTHGMSIYFPSFWLWPPSAYSSWLYFSMDTGWDEFLTSYYNEAGLGNPTVMYSSPEGSGVPTDSVIEIWFSEAMDFSSLQAAFSIDPYVEGELSWDSVDNMLTFTPSSALSLSTTYTLTIDTNATDSGGSHLVSSYVWQFSTGVMIPEFNDIVLPVMGIFAALAVAARFKKH